MASLCNSGGGRIWVVGSLVLGVGPLKSVVLGTEARTAYTSDFGTFIDFNNSTFCMSLTNQRASYRNLVSNISRARYLRETQACTAVQLVFQIFAHSICKWYFVNQKNAILWNTAVYVKKGDCAVRLKNAWSIFVWPHFSSMMSHYVKKCSLRIVNCIAFFILLLSVH